MHSQWHFFVYNCFVSRQIFMPVQNNQPAQLWSQNLALINLACIYADKILMGTCCCHVSVYRRANAAVQGAKASWMAKTAKPVVRLLRSLSSTIQTCTYDQYLTQFWSHALWMVRLNSVTTVTLCCRKNFSLVMTYVWRYSRSESLLIKNPISYYSGLGSRSWVPQLIFPPEKNSCWLKGQQLRAQPRAGCRFRQWWTPNSFPVYENLRSITSNPNADSCSHLCHHSKIVTESGYCWFTRV